MNIKISIKAHGDADGQVQGKLNGQRSLKSLFLFNQEIPYLYEVCKFSIGYHWGGDSLGTTNMVGDK